MANFYLLEIWVAPGMARKGLAWLLSSQAEVEQALIGDFLVEGETDPITLNLITAYSSGEHIQITPYQAGQPGATIDLRPSLTITLADYPPITFDADGQFNAAAFNAGYVDESGAGYTDRVHELINEEADVTAVQLDWAQAAIPPLQPPLLQPGERAAVWSSYVNRTEHLKYGLNDLEFGDDDDEDDEDEED